MDVSISYPAIEGSPISYTTKLWSDKLPQPLLHVDLTPGNFTVNLEEGSHVHQETRALFSGSVVKLVIVKDFQVGGFQSPGQLEVTWDGVCVVPWLPIQLFIDGTVNEYGDGSYPTPNGLHSLTWRPGDAEWQKLIETEEWTSGRSGFLLAVSCVGGLYGLRVLVHPSGEPIGGVGSTVLLNTPVTLDSGGGEFNTTGAATVKFGNEDT